MFNFLSFSRSWRLVAKVFLTTLSFITFLLFVISMYFLGFTQGYDLGQKHIEEYYTNAINVLYSKPNTVSPSPTSMPKIISKPKVSWGGPELWEVVNKRRIELGVNSLSSQGELCTIASIRLNELLDLGKLDGHEGFSNLSERRPDLKWIFEKYSTVAEFLAVGGKTPEETVSLWENTLGHKKLLSGGEYVWGCIYAQNTFAVAITAF